MQTLYKFPDNRGYFGAYGGRFIPETLHDPLITLEKAFRHCLAEPSFKSELTEVLQRYAGRPTPLTFAKNLSRFIGGAKIYLKREDLLHTGAHKINNALGQALLARYMGKKRVVAETGAGQHGVATAAATAFLGLECVIYMGAIDCQRQAPNVRRMHLLGAEVKTVESGGKKLKDAINEAIRDWITHVEDTHYLIGSALGPHPYPLMVREFQRVIGDEVKKQIVTQHGALPDELVACVGGGSNALGLFSAFLDDLSIQMTGVEAGGISFEPGQHAARFSSGSVGVLHGSKSYLLQTDTGQIQETHSISAGLDYQSVGPEHAFLHDCKRVSYTSVSDAQAIEAFRMLCRYEGIIPALESAHAVAYAIERAARMRSDQAIVINLSGRGDKDLDALSHLSNEEYKNDRC